MEDFYLRRRPAGADDSASRRILHLDALTVTGKTVGENIAKARASTTTT